AHGNAAEGPEADALAGQARIALRAAATRASALGSFDQAVVFLAQGLEVASGANDQVEILREAGLASISAGKPAQSEEFHSRAMAIARLHSDQSVQARVLAGLCTALGLQFKVQEALALAEPAIAELADAEETALAELKLIYARCLSLGMGDTRRGIELVEDVLEIAEKRGLIDTLAHALILRGNALYALGRRREAIAVTALARDVAADAGLIVPQLRASGNLNNSMTEFNVERSLEGWREGMALARKAGQRGLVIQAAGNIGYMAFLAGEWDLGLAVMDEWLAEDISARDRLIIHNNATIIRVCRGESGEDALAELERLGKDMSGKWHLFVADPIGNHSLAHGHLEQARDAFMEIAEDDEAQGEEYVYRAGRAVLWMGDAGAAHQMLDRLVALGGYSPAMAARQTTLRGGIAALEGRGAEALGHYRDALRGWREVKNVWDEALTGIDMATLLDPSEPQVAAAIESTRDILERLGAKPFLERLDAAAARRPEVAQPKRAAAARHEVAVAE
ncbi:MAG TPA: hypothetical protein VMZ66_01195, partial [Aeromicrobium sp.]|nr:hypothetical protein [Aeromicrobium sp.]